MAEPGKCRSCGAAIVWMVTSRGKQMPVDAQTVGVPDVKPVSHFATCPQAKKWRKGDG
jgi:hypothetical protein